MKLPLGAVASWFYHKRNKADWESTKKTDIFFLLEVGRIDEQGFRVQTSVIQQQCKVNISSLFCLWLKLLNVGLVHSFTKIADKVWVCTQLFKFWRTTKVSIRFNLFLVPLTTLWCKLCIQMAADNENIKNISVCMCVGGGGLTLKKRVHFLLSQVI